MSDPVGHDLLGHPAEDSDYDAEEEDLPGDADPGQVRVADSVVRPSWWTSKRWKPAILA